jgi:hypothetical protein
MPMDALNCMHYMEYRQVKTSPMKIYNMAYIKLWTLGNKDSTMKVPHVNGASSVGIIPSSVISSLSANYVWAVGTVKTNATTHTDAARLPSHVKFTQTTPDSIMPVAHKVSSIITLSK